jgi:hypothetical protein
MTQKRSRVYYRNLVSRWYKVTFSSKQTFEPTLGRVLAQRGLREESKRLLPAGGIWGTGRNWGKTF